jgi:nucleoid-associated protein YgaU
MPPRRYSRHTFTQGIRLSADEQEPVFLTDRVTYAYRALADNRTHVVKDGDTLWNIAARYFRGLPRPAGLWWVVADFQPDPIQDPTLRLETGRTLFVPSTRTLLEEILSERRRGE